MNRLTGKIAVVFGGAQGIGRAIAAAFVAEGARVHLADLKAPVPGSEPEGLLSSVQFDGSEPAAVAAFIADVLAQSGHIDILVNNIGIHLAKSVIDTEPEEFDRIFAVNVKPIYLASRAALPSMLARRRGSIINLSSNGGLVGRPGDPVYNATKHAVIGLTKSMAVAYAQQGIRVNALCPGAVDTPMLRGTTPAASFEEQLPMLVASTPAARVAHADEVAAAAVFLASDESPAITGIALPIDGAKSAGVLTADRYRTDIALNHSYD